MRVALVFVVVLALPPLVRAQAPATDGSAWQTSFAASSVASYHGERIDRVAVVAAGASTAQTTEAAVALRAAYKAAGAALVLDPSAVADFSSSDDGEVVERLREFPVDQIVIVRVFPGQTAATAVVTVFDRDSRESVIAYSVVEGQVLAPGAPVVSGAAAAAGSAESAAESANAGVSTKAAETIAGLGKKQQTELSGSAAARARYDENYVHFEAWAAAQNGIIFRRWTQAYRGKYRVPLTGASFYEHVGRNDLANSYRRRRRTKVAIWTGSALLGLSSLFFLDSDKRVETGRCRVPSSRPDVCAVPDTRLVRANNVLPIVLLAGGVTSAFIPLLIRSHPVDSPTARRLGAQYNEKLKADLGLSSRAPREPQRSYAVAPFLLAGGAGVALGMSF